MSTKIREIKFIATKIRILIYSDVITEQGTLNQIIFIKFFVQIKYSEYSFNHSSSIYTFHFIASITIKRTF